MRISLAMLAMTSVLAAQNVCSVTTSGTGCASLDITTAPQGNGGNLDLVLTASGLHTNCLGAMGWGMIPINVPLPHGGCPLLVEPFWGTHFVTDNSGVQTWSRTWPHWFHGFFLIQMATVYNDGNDNWEIRTTDCKMIVCAAP